MVTNALTMLDSLTGAAQERSTNRVVKLATVDASYSGGVNGPCRVTFDGESSLTTRSYPCAGYAPVASQRVVMLPVGNTYVVIGALDEPGTALSSGAGQDINLSAGASADIVLTPGSSGGLILAQDIHKDTGIYTRSTDQTLSNNTQTQWTPNTETLDTSLDGFTLSGGGVTVNADGLYWIHCKLAWEGSSGGFRRVLIKIDGGASVDGENIHASESGVITVSATHVAQINDGSEITIEGRHNTGTNLDILGNTNDYSHSRLTIVRLGAKT